MFVELQRDWMGQKTGTVIDLADPDAKILTDGGVARAVAHDPLSPLITKAIGPMLDGMQKAVDAAINKALADPPGQSGIAACSGRRSHLPPRPQAPLGDVPV